MVIVLFTPDVTEYIDVFIPSKLIRADPFSLVWKVIAIVVCVDTPVT
jgi:hypothetical protein